MNPTVMTTQSYAYDPLNRLRSVRDMGLPGPVNCPVAGLPSNAATQCYVYDRYGNRAMLGESVQLSGSQAPVVTTDTAAAVETIYPQNRMNGQGHDAGGYVTGLNGRTIEYDGEGLMVKNTLGAQIVTMAYDGEGKRVSMDRSGAGVVTYVYGAEGELKAEYGGGPGSGRGYLTQDHLGSTRMVTGETGTVAAGYDYLPFGEVVRESGGMAGQTVRFTGKERDEGTGLDNFLARYYNAPVGRFTSPDAPFADQEAEDPQSWNLFAYGRNNPLRFTDPTGRTVCDVNGNHCRDEITVTDTMEKIAVYMFVTTAKVVQSTQEMVQPVADWMNRPRNPICTDGYMGLGASIGFWAGGGLGTLGLAGGPAVAATIPGGAAGGAALGGAIGGFGGLVLCSTGSGTGGGSGASSQSSTNGFWKDLKPFRGKTKTNGLQGKNKRFFEWDHTHGDVEVYDGRGRHLGSADPNTGAMTKPAVPGRSITI